MAVFPNNTLRVDGSTTCNIPHGRRTSMTPFAASAYQSVSELYDWDEYSSRFRL